MDREAAFDTLLNEIAEQPRLAIDTEFHREGSYHPEAALMQIAWPSGIALVDPLAVDVRQFRPILESDTLLVMHASSQDLEVMLRVCGAMPLHLFDTQIAAGFLGMSSPSLSALHERELGVRLPKSSQLTDWLSRPLSDAQRTYAAGDVAYLLDIHERQVTELTARGRLKWVEAECAEFLQKESHRRKPEDAWRRIKDTRKLRGRSRGVAREVAAWREGRASKKDIPVRRLLPDLAVIAIAQSQPNSMEELLRIRGVERRHLGGGADREILAAVQRADELPADKEVVKKESRNSRDMRAGVALVSAWLFQMARDSEIDPTLLGTRADIEALVRGEEDCRMGTGWRHDLVGTSTKDLLSGRASLAFDGEGRLLLEDREI